MSHPFSSRLVGLSALVLVCTLFPACSGDDPRAQHAGLYTLDRRAYVVEYVGQRLSNQTDTLRELAKAERTRRKQVWIREAKAKAKALTVELRLEPDGRFAVRSLASGRAQIHSGTWTKIAGGVRLHTSHEENRPLKDPYVLDADLKEDGLHIARDELDQPFVLRRSNPK